MFSDKDNRKKGMIRTLLIGYAAAFFFVLFSFAVGRVAEPEPEPAEPQVPETTIAMPETLAGASTDTRKLHFSVPASSLKELEQKEEEFEPAPDKLNLAYYFPEDADTTDSINSYAGIIYTNMNAANADFFASYYDLTDTTPLKMAQSRGLGAERVMGKYNEEDSAHDPRSGQALSISTPARSWARPCSDV